MSGGQKFTLTFDAQLNVGQMKGALNQIQSTLNSLHLPQNLSRGLQGTIDSLSKEIQSFEVALGKDITGKADFNKLNTQAQKITDSFEKLKLQVRDITGLSGKDLEKLFPSQITQNITSATTAINQYKQGLKEAKNEVNSAESAVNKLKSQLDEVKNKKPMSDADWKQLKNDISSAEAEVKQYTDAIKQAEQTSAEVVARSPNNYKKSSIWRQAQQDIEAYKKALTEAQTKVTQLTQIRATGITNTKQAQEIENLNTKLIQAQERFNAAQQALQQFESAGTGGGFQKLVEQIGQLTGQDMSNFSGGLKELGEVVGRYITQQMGEASTKLQQLKTSADQASPAFKNLSSGMNDSAAAIQAFDARLQDVQAFKSRIQYFFGLNNAINLFKRAIRGAFDTIKELDKAMTETAVVTNYTVKDMWDQLPEYTKRANELGVTTKDAYESATLYFQQGLNADQAAALSVETLKMARIAGLDAAEATDRMTNALRGFNMALDEKSAQRVDDVYSELAANTASNVDEISTAMTKVASLAHSANMEFETTAAFLAQIIETTRESAETAGTALKTVVARFSEVKKLVDTNQLKGQDEEGQVIDVNKVGAALRTAGIDLNKYFLGEVGLDDIFMELASKWDSLTSVQQRYIATQAAGSRQQSRFIALMQDYARMQELVGKAYNAEGASARQFEKTQDSLQSKLARLKNAWNEFLMGLANSSIVKGVVDGLTTLLNIVNKLTTGFSEGTSFILKWVAALSTFAAVKSVFKTGGFLDLLLMGGLQAGGKGALANAAVRTGLLSGLTRGANGTFVASDIVSGQARETALANANAVNQRQGSVIFGGLGGLGKKAWSGAQKLGAGITGKSIMPAAWAKTLPMGAGMISETAAGLTGIATALGAVAVATGAVISAYQMWLHLTPEGQLKQAKQLAKVMNQVAASTEQNVQDFKKATESYKEYDTAVKSASNAAEYQKAVGERNDYITSLIQSNPNVAKYVTATTENGEFTLTINQQDLEKATEEAAKKASEAAVDANFANALAAGKQADIYAKKLSNAGVNIERGTIYDPNAPGEARTLNTNEAAKYLAIKGQLDAARAEQEAYAQQAFARQLEDSGLDDNLSNLLSKALAKTFDEDQYLKDINQQRWDNWIGSKATKSQLREQYYELYGVQADSKMNRRNLAKAVATRQVDQEQEKTTKAAADAVKSGRYDDILKAIAGEIDFSDAQLELEETTKKLEDFHDITGISVEDLKTQIKQGQKVRQEIKKGRQTDIFEQALKSGHGVNKDFFDTIKGLDFEQLGVVSDIINQAAGKVSEQTFQSLFDSLPKMDNASLQQLQTFFDGFNLDNPIQALDQLNSKIAEVGANSDFGKLLADIKETNSALFESSNLVQTFLLSESYEQLGDTIEDLTKDNKKLNGKNIEDMAESCQELDTLLKELNADFGENTDSAQALAEAINLIAEGSLGIDQITSSLLAALGAGKSFESMIGDVQSWVEDFDEGTDLKFGTEHIISELESLGKYVDNWEFGNEPTENIYNHLFNTKEGENAYQQLLTKYGNDFEGLENYIEGRIETLNKWSENEGLGGIQEALSKGVTGLKEISGSGGQFFNWDLTQFSSTTDAINEVANALNVSQGAAEAFILSWQTHIPKLRTEWNDLQFKDAINAFTQDLGDGTVITQQELDALAAQFGKEATDIKAAIDEVRAAAGKPITVTVDWQDETGGALSGQELIDKFNDTVKAPIKRQYVGSQLESSTDYSDFLKGIDGVSRQVKSELGQTLNTLDFDTLHQHLVNAFKLTPAQATEVADNIVHETNQSFSKDIQVPVKLDDGTFATETKTITANSSEALQASIDAALEAANYSLVAQALADASDFTTLGDKVEAALQAGASTLPEAIKTASAGVEVNIPVHWDPIDPFPTGGTAAGGIVHSYGGGSENRSVSPGLSLTGEEGPEIVWNKQKGYAYITGQHHPQFQNLQPGDRVFNAQETRKILKGSLAKGGLIDSYASGGWKPPSNKNSGGGGGGGKSSGSDKEKTPDEWKNELDWLYNLMEDIAELERDQKAIEEQYEDALKDQTKTGKDLYNLLVKQLGNLYTQLNHQTFALEKREQEMREFMDITNDKDQYLWYNWQDRTIEIDWDAIDQITDEEEYKHVKELIDEAEEIQDKMDDADDAIMDITNQIQELENIWRDTFTDFEDRVYDAIVKSYQQVIDEYSELNDTLNNSNSQILDSLQKQISLQRQIRDNTKTEEEITDDEARLAYLRRDTSGGNDLAALQLEKELSEQRQNYEDTLVDQAVSRLQEDNDAAAQQRQQQIDIMQAQLDYQSQNGEFNAAVRELLESAMGGEGELLTNSDLVSLLKEQENWNAMSDVSKEVWDEELNGTFKEVAAFLLKENSEQNGTFYTALTKAVESVSTAIGSYSQAMTKLGNQISSAGSSGGGGGGGGGGGSPSSPGGNGNYYYNSLATGQKVYSSTIDATTLKKNQALMVHYGGTVGKKYATGGLADVTGLAWLDGTPSEPEYVLNARQTDAFLKLADVLPSMMGSGASAQTNTFGSTYITMPITLESVNPDYDVDRMVDLLKDKLYDAGSYRNVNSLSFIR